MSDEPFDVEGFVRTLILPVRALTLLRVEQVETPGEEAYRAHYQMTGAGGQKRKAPIDVSWNAEAQVLRFIATVHLPLVDGSDRAEMGCLAMAVNEVNAADWLAGKVVLSTYEDSDAVDVSLISPLFIPADHFESLDRINMLRVLAGYNLCNLVGEMETVVRIIEDQLRPSAVKEETGRRVLQ